VMPLSSLLPPLGDGSAGFVLLGILENDQSGNAVGGAVDMNGDGIDDIIIGAHHRDVGTRHDAGQAYVVYGRDTARTGNFPAAFPLADLLPDAGGDGTGGFVLNGINADDTAGQSVSTAGDINGDGIGDLVIGAPQADPQGRISAGQSYVVFGRNAAVVGSFPPVFALSSLLPTGGGDGSAGFVIAGRREDHSGYALSAAGDVNSDGTADLLIGAPGDNPRPGGRAYVLYGRDTAQTGDFPAVFGLGTLFRGAGGDGSEGFVLAGIRVGDNVGLSVDALGDVNDDGMDDMIVGTIGTDGGVSACSVIYGRSQSP